MTNLLAKLIFLFLGVYTGITVMYSGEHAGQDFDPVFITVLFITVTATALLQYFGSTAVTVVVIGIYGAAYFFVPAVIYFIPVLFLDLTSGLTNKKFYIVLIVPLLAAWQGSHIFFFIYTASALLTGYLLDRTKVFAAVYTSLQDSYTEQSLKLRSRNKELLDTQDKIANLAVLQERSRIAKDIHDNIGHILVRAILLTGALKATSKSPEIKEPVATLEIILKEAMNTIRSAVHGWKHESIDLYESVKKLRSSTNLEIVLQYDISDQIPTDVKLGFLMVIKEALTNSAKHSSASVIRITLQEHPALYQLLIKDNGNSKSNGKIGLGMGLSNIEERILGLGGTCRFEDKNGFKIFISIPKSKE